MIRLKTTHGFVIQDKKKKLNELLKKKIMITSNTDILSMMIKLEKINYALELKRTKYLILVQDLERAFAAPPRDGRSAA